MARWFRAYDDALDDPKVQRLPGDIFKAWFNILCLASRHNGALPPLPDISFSLRLSEKDTAKVIETLEKAGLIDRDGETFQPHNWNGRQFSSDVSNERVKRHRERKKVDTGNADVTLHATPPEADTEADTEQNRAASAARRKRAPETELRVAIVDEYRKSGREIPPDTGQAAVWLASGYPAEFCLAVIRSKIPGNADKNLPWFAKIIKDEWEKRPKTSTNPEPPDDPDNPMIDLGCGCQCPKIRLNALISAWLSDRRNNRWNESIHGPPPDEPGCRVPSAILAEHGLQRVPYPPDDEAAA